MKHIYLVNYRVKGIKTLEEEVSLSFYKKTITMPIDTKEYNIKGIYGINGSGKSGIVASVDILRNLLLDDGYLNNPMVQKNLDAIINFLAEDNGKTFLYNYEIVLKKASTDKFIINGEKIAYKLATSRKDEFISLVAVSEGIITYIDIKREVGLKDILVQTTMNLLSMSTVSAVFLDKMISIKEKMFKEKIHSSMVIDSLWALLNLGIRIYIYIWISLITT